MEGVSSRGAPLTQVRTTEKPMAEPKLVQSVVRGMQMLELVSRVGSGIDLRTISEVLELKSPTAHNLLRTLVELGYLQKTTRPVRYVLGPRLPELARHQAEHSLLSRAEEVLPRLFEQLKPAFQKVVESLEYGKAEL